MAKGLKPGDKVLYGSPLKSGVITRRADEIQPGVVEIKPDDGGRVFHQQEYQITRGRHANDRRARLHDALDAVMDKVKINDDEIGSLPQK